MRIGLKEITDDSRLKQKRALKLYQWVSGRLEWIVVVRGFIQMVEFI